ncbi:Mu phage protease GpI [Klebsiella sp. WP3-W18-ESBL-02]|uniref:phage protease n=1 Tax=Klebsiella sp. WP3-W18-ESBL-02 TaxID=2675710 RepID=UPI0015DCBAAF|nr:phage protease [Klebsiella sp. WP3-W18-ESBL-02]BBQ85756.1 Mu phage protease GpI [Klebsiella sp. WP3-W18-ESBL-02]BBQ85780.1 Mu phage protease GpI [Klebsiella sp. WP3-W18-ESBL-02]
MNLIAFCSELKADKTAPDWIELLPAGPDIQGRDGRKWRLSNPQSLVDAFNKRALPLVVDYEHSTEISAANGSEAPAAGWIETLEVREDGSVWGKVDWTQKASNSILSKEYRFISPAFHHVKDGDITRLSSAALTNKPNLDLTALNSQDEWSVVAKALGVETISSPRDILNALNKSQSTMIQDVVDDVISKAVFCPAQREHLVAMCSQVGVDEFRKFSELQMKVHGVVVNSFATTRRSRTRETSGRLTDSQVAVCRSTGVSEEEYLTALGKQND